MTSELERQFFETFDIEPTIEQCYHFCNRDLNCKECDEATRIYPSITDSILLELICILLSYNSPYIFKLGNWNISKLKDTILDMCIKLPDYLEWKDTSEYFKQQVRTLFEENN